MSPLDTDIIEASEDGTLEPKIPKGASYSENQLTALRNSFNEVLGRLQNEDCASLFTDFYDNTVQSLSDMVDFDPTGGISNILADFRQRTERNPSKVFKNILFRFIPFPRQPGQGLAGASAPDRNNIHINSNGPFVSRNILVDGRRRNFDFGVSGVQGLSQAEYGALLLLHELGHAYGAIRGDYLFFGADVNDAKLNLEHTRAVIDACFPELRRN